MAAITVAQALQTAASFRQMGQLAVAESIYRQIVHADPRQAEAWYALGTMAIFARRPEEAVRLLAEAVSLVPGNATYLSDLGVAYRHAGHVEEAVVSFRRAAELLPQAAGIHLNLGEALATLGRYEEAIGCYERAVALRPDFAEAHSNLGRALMQMGRLDEAVSACERAVTLRPELPEAHLNLGAVFVRLRRLEPAMETFRRAIGLRPDFSEAHQTLSFILLLLGRYEEGWREHEWRWQCPDWSRRWLPFAARRWMGGPTPEATVWLLTEQGAGDLIQFLRYVPFVRERTEGDVALYCTPPFERLLSAQGNCPVRIIARESLDGTTLPARDYYLPLLSLPATLGMDEPRAMAGAYLQADERLRAVWRERLRMAEGLRVGLVWAGNPSHRDDRLRSIEFARLAPFFEIAGVSFISLQIQAPRAVSVPPEAKSGWVDLTAQIADFADTAAMMAELDLVISVDTAAAHLAGAMGRPVWTLLPFVPDWRWGLGREETPWYPTMRLFRQTVVGEWAPVVQRVVEELKALVAAGAR